MSITKTQAQTDSQIANDAAILAANTRFIAAVDQQILEAIDQGKFFVNSTTFDDIDIKEIGQYYTNLGYEISLPDYPSNLLWNSSPSVLFGTAWEDFWNTGVIPPNIPKPYRFLISWKV